MLIVNDLSGNGMGTGFVYRALVEGQLTGVGAGEHTRVYGMFNAGVSGTFVATLELQRSLDNGVTWNDVTAGGLEMDYTEPCQEVFDEPEPQALYRWYCKAYTSGTINYRIGQ